MEKFDGESLLDVVVLEPAQICALRKKRGAKCTGAGARQISQQIQSGRFAFHALRARNT